MNDGETSTSGSFRELRADVEGAWSKARLTSKFLASYMVFAATEYFENAMAVIVNKDPATYSAEKDQRREQMVTRLGEWAVERQMLA